MGDIDLQVRFNGKGRISFTRGEDRALEVLLYDAVACLPVSLDSATVTLAFPRDGGGSIKRRSAPLYVPLGTSVVLNSASVFYVTNHGLVDGETVTLQVLAGAQLPAPFAEGTGYLVVVQDGNSFSLTALDGTPQALAAQASGGFYLVGQDLVITNPVLGALTYTLSSQVSAEVASGQGQSFQLTLTGPNGLTRIFVGNAALDVFSQPCP